MNEHPVATAQFPWPDELEQVVKELEYKPGWVFELKDMAREDGCSGLCLVIVMDTRNSYPPHGALHLKAVFSVPAETYDFDSWRDWVLQQILLLERHEASENFIVAGRRPYAPDHSMTGNAYWLRERVTHGQVDRRRDTEREAQLSMEPSEAELKMMKELGVDGY